MAEDSQKLSRTAQQLIVEYKTGVGNPPSYGSQWLPGWDVKVDRIEINAGVRPSVAALWFPTLRWNENPPFSFGDTVRIRTNEPDIANRTILFVGYVVNRPLEFSGGTEKPGAGFERSSAVCMDQRWVLATSIVHYGQFARGPDDFEPDTDPPEPKLDSDTELRGQRTVFNPDGKPNLDPVEEESDRYPNFPLFCNPGKMGAKFWTARDMIRFLLHPSWFAINRYCPIDDPSLITGLEEMDDADEDAKNWGKVLHNITIDGLSVIEAVGLVCKHTGWNFRLNYTNDGKTYFCFYKIGIRDQAYRTNSPVISHKLYAPPVGGSVGDAVREGNKMLWSMSLAQDIIPVVNKPIAIGAPDRFEFSAELSPAWFDSYLTLPTDLAELFYTDAELQNKSSPDSLFYYTNYHSRGIAHNAGAKLRNVGRKWVLNESGFYTDPDMDDGKDYYNRGTAFDWKTVVPTDFIYLKDAKTGRQKRAFAPYNRKLLPCLTVHSDGQSSVGIKLEFSFDSGVTWQVIPCSVRLLESECGIFIEEPNLAEIVDKKEGQIASGDLAGKPINLFTSICDDKKNERIYKNKEWHTRIRVTASVQMDQRVVVVGKPSSASGSPFDQTQLYDWSDKYGLAKRTISSVFASGLLTAAEVDSTKIAEAHVDSIRKNNEDMTISGRFTLDRLWTGDGAGIPAFMIGDAINSISGREFPLELATFGGGKTSPEIIQIIYLPESQKQVLITRDLRYAEVLV
jgi:hypothetical protein